MKAEYTDEKAKLDLTELTKRVTENLREEYLVENPTQKLVLGIVLLAVAITFIREAGEDPAEFLESCLND